MGPSAIRYAGLEERLASFGCSVVDRGNVVAPEPEALAGRDERARFLPEILEACARLAGIVQAVVADGSVPLVLGGDHSIALGTLAGLRAAAGQMGGVVWIDAHGDLNTPETSPSGNEWGMPLRMIIDRGAADPHDIALVGARNLDPPEVEFIAAAGIHDDPQEVLDRVDCVYVALDCDIFEPSELAVFMPEPGGPSVTEIERLFGRIRTAVTVVGVGLTGLAPDRENVSKLERLTTALGL